MRLDIAYLLLTLSILGAAYGLYRWQNHRRRERLRIWGSAHRNR